MKSRTLLLLAGYPGVGKSSLLAAAIKHRIPIFGEAFDEAFRVTRPPPSLPEHTLRGEELLAAGSWFTDHHLPFLLDLEALPPCVVLHIDLVSSISYRPHLRNLPDHLLALTQSPIKTLANPELAGALYRHVLGYEFFRRFDAVVVNTLTAPWAMVAEHWHARDEAQGQADTVVAKRHRRWRTADRFSGRMNE